MTEIAVANMTLGNHRPMSLIGGMNVIESRDLVMRVAEAFVKVTGELGLPYIFKASFDKANRTSASAAAASSPTRLPFFSNSSRTLRLKYLRTMGKQGADGELGRDRVVGC